VNMLVKERFEVNKEIHELFFMLRAQQLWGNQQCLLELYGEEIEPFSFDAATTLIAMINGYMSYVVMEQMKLDFHAVSEFVVDRLDDMVQGMLKGQVKPVLNTAELEQFFTASPRQARSAKSALHAELQANRVVIEQLKRKPAEMEEIQSAMQVLEAELDKDEPQAVMVKGKIALLKSLKIPELKKHLTHIEVNLL
jgi:hypothetical protein